MSRSTLPPSSRSYGRAPATAPSCGVTATLLLDAAGTLAGVDLRGPGGDGWVVMLGPHEDVASTEGGHSVDVASDETGKPSLVRVPGARPRGAEMSIL